MKEEESKMFEKASEIEAKGVGWLPKNKIVIAIYI